MLPQRARCTKAKAQATSPAKAQAGAPASKRRKRRSTSSGDAGTTTDSTVNARQPTGARRSSKRARRTSSSARARAGPAATAAGAVLRAGEAAPAAHQQGIPPPSTPTLSSASVANQPSTAAAGQAPPGTAPLAGPGSPPRIPPGVQDFFRIFDIAFGAAPPQAPGAPRFAGVPTATFTFRMPPFSGAGMPETNEEYLRVQAERRAKAKADQVRRDNVRLFHAAKGPADFDTLSVRQLKDILTVNTVDHALCLMKQELRAKVVELWHRTKKEEEKEKEIPKCVICMDKSPNCVFLGCAHHITCIDCGQRCSECPVCRKPIKQHLRTYVA